jgi:ribosomal protein S18 acetylase RimI-like enzyme
MSAGPVSAIDPVFEQLGRAFLGAGRLFATPGSVEGQRPGLWYSAVGGPIPGFNRLVVTEMTEASVDADLDAALDEHKRFPILSAWIPPGAQPSDVADRFTRRGFVADDELVPAMSAELAEFTLGDPPDDVEWTVARDPAATAIAIDVLCRGFEVPDSVRPVFEHALALPPNSPPQLGTFVVSHAGQPSATALGVLVDDVVAIYNVATVPEARGRGLGSFATRLAMQHGLDGGARTAILEASEMGHSIYLRLGFREVGRYRVLVRRAEGAIELPL